MYDQAFRELGVAGIQSHTLRSWQSVLTLLSISFRIEHISTSRRWTGCHERLYPRGGLGGRGMQWIDN